MATMQAGERRLLLGLAAVLLTVTGCVLVFAFEGEGTWQGGLMCLRGALVLGVAWLAFPQLITLSGKCPLRLMLASWAAAAVLVIRPRAFPLVAAIVAGLTVLEGVGWLLRPLPQKRPPADGPPADADRVRER